MAKQRNAKNGAEIREEKQTKKTENATKEGSNFVWCVIVAVVVLFASLAIHHLNSNRTFQNEDDPSYQSTANYATTTTTTHTTTTTTTTTHTTTSTTRTTTATTITSSRAIDGETTEGIFSSSDDVISEHKDGRNKNAKNKRQAAYDDDDDDDNDDDNDDDDDDDDNDEDGVGKDGFDRGINKNQDIDHVEGRNEEEEEEDEWQELSDKKHIEYEDEVENGGVGDGEDEEEEEEKKDESLDEEVERRLKKRLDEMEERIAENKEKALEHYRAILKLQPKDAVILYGKMRCLEDGDERIDTCFDLLSLAPLSPPFTFLVSRQCLGVMMRVKGNDDLAEEIFSILIEMYPGKREEYLSLVHPLLALHHPTVAITALQLYLQNYPDDVRATSLLKVAHKQEYEEHQELIDHVMSLVQSRDPPRDAILYIEAADSLLREGRKVEAKHIQTRAVELGVMTSVWQHDVEHEDGLLNKVWWSVKDVQGGVKEAMMGLLKGMDGVMEEVGGVYLGEGRFNGVEEEEEDDKRTDLHTGRYRHITLFSFGAERKSTCSIFPTLCALLRGVPDIMCQQCQTKLLLVEPSSSFSRHTSPSNTIIIVFLPISFHPSDRLSVREESRDWSGLMLYDPSFHTNITVSSHIRSETDEEEKKMLILPDSWRLVLQIQIWHPHLTKEQKTHLPSFF